MSIQAMPGGVMMAGPRPWSAPHDGVLTIPMNIVKRSAHIIGRMVTSDGGSHTIDTTGSSSIGWLTAGTAGLANAGSSLTVGIAAVDLSNGPPARAANASGVITFDVAKVYTGGAGVMTADTWYNSVPSTGSKTIANGDLVAVCMQLTAQGASDRVDVSMMGTNGLINRPSCVQFDGSGSYSTQLGLPNVFITFSDGAFGWLECSDVRAASATRTWNSGSATKEYGQLFQFPFPVRVVGVYGDCILTAADTDVVLYSDPLGTPVARATAFMDANAVTNSQGRVFNEYFATAYDVAANTPIVAAYKPGSSNVGVYYKTLNNANHRRADPWGTSGYGVSRASGAFANANSSLEHYHIGLLLGGFDGGGIVYPRSGLQDINEGISR